ASRGGTDFVLSDTRNPRCSSAPIAIAIIDSIQIKDAAAHSLNSPRRMGFRFWASARNGGGSSGRGGVSSATSSTCFQSSKPPARRIHREYQHHATYL